MEKEKRNSQGFPHCGSCTRSEKKKTTVHTHTHPLDGRIYYAYVCVYVCVHVNNLERIKVR